MFMKFVASVALTALACGMLSTPADAQRAESRRIEQCSLIIAGDQFIEGPCDFTMLDDDGSFQIMSTDGLYFAQVIVTAPGEGMGYWNEDAGANHAHSPLGQLSRDGACWSTPELEVCAR